MKQELEQRIRELEEKMPGIGEKLRDRTWECWAGDKFNIQCRAVSYTETENYLVIASLWWEERTVKDEEEPYVAYTDIWSEVYFTPKDGGEIKKIESEKLMIKNKFYSCGLDAFLPYTERIAAIPANDYLEIRAQIKQGFKAYEDAVHIELVDKFGRSGAGIWVDLKKANEHEWRPDLPGLFIIINPKLSTRGVIKSNIQIKI